jgi:hypothetical protein
MKHHPAKFDIYGFPKKVEHKPNSETTNALAAPVGIPQNWSKNVENRMTKTKLEQ